jgi:hypothetical protein
VTRRLSKGGKVVTLVIVHDFDLLVIDRAWRAEAAIAAPSWSGTSASSSAPT